MKATSKAVKRAHVATTDPPPDPTVTKITQSLDIQPPAGFRASVLLRQVAQQGGTGGPGYR